MAKKLLSLTLIMMLIGAVSVIAQTCVPDGQYTKAGVYPDTLVGLPCAEEGVLYETTITVIAPVDSLYDLGFPIGTINATIDSIVVQDNTGDGIAVNGLPSGFVPICNPPSCSFPGGSTGCLLLIGTPGVGTAGTYNIVVEVDAYVLELEPLSANPINMDKVDQYSVVVSATAPPTVSVSGVDATAGPPSCDGSATASGGVTYQWDNAAGAGTSATAGTLCEGTYNVAAKDVNGCASIGTVTINLSACSPTVAGFTSNAVGLSAVFTDASTNTPTSWAWDFGDGNTSTEQSPVHVYSADSTYTVCLTSTNACSSDSSCSSITVSGSSCTPCVAGFSSADIGLDVTFTDGSTDATGWAWTFGDGNTSTSVNPSHTYAAEGTYNVCLITTNPCSADTTCADITITAVGIEQQKGNIVGDIKAIPNPFADKTDVIFNLVEPGTVHFIVFDRIGKIVYSETREANAGRNSIEVSAEGITPGIYMYNLVSGANNISGKMSIVK